MNTVNSPEPVVEFFWRPGCPFCASLDRALRRKRIAFTKRNIWDDPEAASLVRKAARGNETVPTVNIAGTYLVNPSARDVIDLLNTVATPDHLDHDPKGTTMRAVWNGTIIAESDDTVVVEGNHYFPIDAVDQALVRPSETHTVCPWKGTASYFDVVVDGKVKADAAWYYPSPSMAARKIKGHVAFWKGVRVEQSPAATGGNLTDPSISPTSATPGWGARLRSKFATKAATSDTTTAGGDSATNVTDLSDDTFAAALEGGLTVVDFWAPWCGPCKAFHPTFEAIAADNSSESLRFARINVDESPQTAARYQVMSIPTLLILDETGEPIDLAIGAQPRAKVESMLRDAVTHR